MSRFPCRLDAGRRTAGRFYPAVAPTRAAIGLLILWLFPAGLLPAAETNLADLKAAERHCQWSVERSMAATVGIINPDMAGPNAMGHGSGVVVSEDGVILTAAHVLGKPNSELIAVFADGRRVKAVSLGADRSRDAGMAKLTEPGKYPFVEMGHSADLKTDDWCLAMGHPGGVQEGRTPPLRLGRILSAGKGTSLVDCIRSDATTISGDSGGPLFDLDGRLIGIHSNIGTMVLQNQHVPVDVYREIWSDLLAGKQTGELPSNVGQGGPPGISPQDAEKFNRQLKEHVQAHDPDVMGLVKDGKVEISGKKMLELMAKWNAVALPESKPIDVLRFYRLFEDRLIAGDTELQALIKDGKMMLTPAQMFDLSEKWEMESFRKTAAALGVDLDKFRRLLVERALSGDSDAAARFTFATAKTTPPEIKELMLKWEKDPKPAVTDVSAADIDAFTKHLKMLSDGRIVLALNTDAAGKFALLLNKFGIAPRGAEVHVGKGGPAVLTPLAPVAAAVSPSIVTILCDGKPTVLGTVVRKDGYIITKASELTDKLACRVGGRDLPATLIKKNDEFDLALLKVEATDLTPIAWAGGDSPRLGTWLVVPGTDGKPIALGTMSIASRPIAIEPIMLVRNAAAMGVQLGDAEGPAKIVGVGPAGPAEKAGIKAGDVIVAVNGQAAANSSEVRAAISKFSPGDKVNLDLKRGEEDVKVTVELGSAGQLSAPPGDAAAHKLDALSSLGGTISKRHNKFPQALTHDAVIQASQCGGPVTDLDGKVIGLNIARADRTATYAIPAAKAQAAIDALLPAQ